MSRKHTYATKGQLETLVRRMHRTGILYFEGLAEFRKQFILVVLRDVKWNKSKAARVLGMHRSTLVRALRELNVNIRALRDSERRPPHGIRPQQQKRNVG
jgi:Fis family transcriptional regulator, factor for inversion stimulation protein